jgi:lysophospholipase L1-like esterase
LTLPGGTPVEEPAHPAKPNPAIRLVTYTIGGNDAGFATILEKCVNSNNAVVNAKTGYTLEGCLKVIKEFEEGVGVAAGAGFPLISEKLPEVLKKTHEFAPNALLGVVLYPKVLDNLVAGNVPVGEPTVGILGPVKFWVDAGAKNPLNTFEQNLDKVIRETVEKWATEEGFGGSRVIETSQALKRHQLGDEANGLWVNTILFKGTTPLVEGFHPNVKGQEALRKKVQEGL